MLDEVDFGDLAGSSSDSDGSAQAAAKRRDCPRCNRPPRVCVCPALPDAPLRLRGKVFILQHPYELKKRMATVALLTRCLDEASLSVLPARRLQQAGRSPETDAMLSGAARGDYPLYVLFPGPGAVDLAEVAASPPHGARLQAAAPRLQTAAEQQAGAAAEPAVAPGTSSADAGAAGAGAPEQPAYMLVVVDGTWRQAKEMFKVSLKPSDVLPPPPPAADVVTEAPPTAAPQPAAAGQGQGAAAGAGAGAGADVAGDAATGAAAAAAEGALQYDPSMPCLIRKEPVEGFVTTYEATARALGLLERSPQLADSLLAPLRLMTRLQAAFDPAIRSRMLQQPEPPRPQQGKAAAGGQEEVVGPDAQVPRPIARESLFQWRGSVRSSVDRLRGSWRTSFAPRFTLYNIEKSEEPEKERCCPRPGLALVLTALVICTLVVVVVPVCTKYDCGVSGSHGGNGDATVQPSQQRPGGSFDALAFQALFQLSWAAGGSSVLVPAGSAPSQQQAACAQLLSSGSGGANSSTGNATARGISDSVTLNASLAQGMAEALAQLGAPGLPVRVTRVSCTQQTATTAVTQRAAASALVSATGGSSSSSSGGSSSGGVSRAKLDAAAATGRRQARRLLPLGDGGSLPGGSGSGSGSGARRSAQAAGVGVTLQVVFEVQVPTASGKGGLVAAVRNTLLGADGAAALEQQLANSLQPLTGSSTTVQLLQPLAATGPQLEGPGGGTTSPFPPFPPMPPLPAPKATVPSPQPRPAGTATPPPPPLPQQALPGSPPPAVAPTPVPAGARSPSPSPQPAPSPQPSALPQPSAGAPPPSQQTSSPPPPASSPDPAASPLPAQLTLPPPLAVAQSSPPPPGAPISPSPMAPDGSLAPFPPSPENTAAPAPSPPDLPPTSFSPPPPPPPEAEPPVAAGAPQQSPPPVAGSDGGSTSSPPQQQLTEPPSPPPTYPPPQDISINVLLSQDGAGRR
ncbi:hypothetical protein HXX76_007906 [Chlamydomonas incerta]|uniref:tRNA-uridine aminocarboxypropyltransferase n=1 Tax=Chlamydomonas incerta TaxID=51695 RepID=A0A835T5F0_CHLIN|nr:hypothetical protein HXX76_007906 [Chlamydomonas incerta]|eukprot:KAG2434179.1 hypothetical protein HXX76_007906 [Chlamydomonas incerta]